MKSFFRSIQGFTIFSLLFLLPKNNTDHQVVGLGFHDDYKVVQLLSSLKPRCLHASLYLAMANSWRKLDLDPNLVIKEPIKSVSKNESFADWEGQNTSGKEIILSFDMKNEVFRTITISCDSAFGHRSVIVLLVIEIWKLSELIIWYNVNNVERSFSAAPPNWRINDIPNWRIDVILIRRNDNCVVLRVLHIRSDYIPIGMNYNTGCKSSEVILYEYRARKLIGRFKMHESSNMIDDIIEYEGSFL